MRQLFKQTRALGAGAALLTLVTGCAGQNAPTTVNANHPPREASPAAASTASGSGERYAMSGDAYPVEPPDVSQVPDAQPRIEAPSRAGNRSTYQVWGETYHVLPSASGYTKQGTASWYGEKFHGYATSNGEIYDMYKMSAAHRSLPLPTFARITSLDSGNSVIVRVNDRGPFHSDREIDLSYAAAARLGILDNGTGRVRVEAIDPQQWLANRGGGARPVPAAASSRAPAVASVPAQAAAPTPAPARAQPATGGDEIYLQIAALGNEESARALQQRLGGELLHSVRVQSDDDVHRVQVGPMSPNQEQQARVALGQAGFSQVFVVR
ncbi:septal ring lytic transglycosylase RlpA family protein [Halomonas sp. GD1P12]|uniref:septal ring lytic transglycosylase RlpA family protein n=1 Tax=Halomonas sp. GD1P12 TaxID=2982691 RepID=UPI0021E4718A|nr:septal ring lytic transglycosylase RlpA family protein [Halomonas sp. GD1P12]UYG01329.1 septal ring lytic transglycosylase RlpA family protein [Halomonas sp. GD1P12]